MPVESVVVLEFILFDPQYLALVRDAYHERAAVRVQERHQGLGHCLLDPFIRLFRIKIDSEGGLELQCLALSLFDQPMDAFGGVAVLFQIRIPFDEIMHYPLNEMLVAELEIEKSVDRSKSRPDHYQYESQGRVIMGESLEFYL